jgi:hypothetical protein
MPRNLHGEPTPVTVIVLLSIPRTTVIAPSIEYHHGRHLASSRM